MSTEAAVSNDLFARHTEVSAETTGKPAKTLTDKTITGGALMVTFRFLDRLLGVGSTLILARLLVPDDFGVVAMAMSFVAVVEVLGEMGFDIVLIKKQDAGPVLYDSAWTAKVVLGITFAAVLFFGREAASAFYSEPRLMAMMPIFALATFVQGLENIGIANFRKELKFDKEFKFLLTKRLTGAIVTITLAFLYRSYWALVIGILSARCIGVVLSYAMHEYRPRFRTAGLPELFSFIKWLFLTKLTNFVNWRLADFVVGKTAGAESLGAYRIAFEIAMLPTAYVIGPVNTALFPAYAHKAADEVELRSAFLKAMSVIILVALPAGLGLAAIADLAVVVVLGTDWAMAGRLLQALAIFGTSVAILSNIGPVLVALGKPKLESLLTALFMVLLIPILIWLAGKKGAVGAADAYAISGLLVIPFNYVLISMVLRLGPGDLLVLFLRPVIGVAVMLVVVRQMLAGTTLTGSVAEAGLLAVTILSAMMTYAVTVCLLWFLSGRRDGAEQWLLSQLLKMKHRRFGNSRGEE